MLIYEFKYILSMFVCVYVYVHTPCHSVDFNYTANCTPLPLVALWLLRFLQKKQKKSGKTAAGLQRKSGKSGLVDGKSLTGHVSVNKHFK